MVLTQIPHRRVVTGNTSNFIINIIISTNTIDAIIAISTIIISAIITTTHAITIGVIIAATISIAVFAAIIVIFTAIVGGLRGFTQRIDVPH